MDRSEAEQLLEDVEVVPVMQAPLAEAKQIVEACLAADVPALLGRDDHCTKGCSPKLLVLARPEDAPRVAALLRAQWRDLVEREGGEPVLMGAAESDDLPCPACGTVIPAEAPECPDCGLVV